MGISKADRLGKDARTGEWKNNTMNTNKETGCCDKCYRENEEVITCGCPCHKEPDEAIEEIVDATFDRMIDASDEIEQNGKEEHYEVVTKREIRTALTALSEKIRKEERNWIIEKYGHYLDESELGSPSLRETLSN